MNLTYEVTAQTSMTSPQSPPNQNRAEDPDAFSSGRQSEASEASEKKQKKAAPKPKAAGGAPAGRLVIGEFGSEPLGVIPSPKFEETWKTIIVLYRNLGLGSIQ